MAKHEMSDTPPEDGETIIDLDDAKVYDTRTNPAREIDLPHKDGAPKHGKK